MIAVGKNLYIDSHKCQDSPTENQLVIWETLHAPMVFSWQKIREQLLQSSKIGIHLLEVDQELRKGA